MQIAEFFSNKINNVLFRKQATFFMSSWNRKCLFSSSNFVSRIEFIFSPTSFVNNFSINFGNISFLEIRKLFIFNSVIFFIYNIRRTTSPGDNRGVGSPQSIYTILGLTLNYHVFLNIVIFYNTYPSQPYTSHALHAFSGSSGPYCSVLGIHFSTWTMVKREHDKGVSKFQVDIERKIESTTILSPVRKEWFWYHKGGRDIALKAEVQ